jgi:peptide/nickel transport system ATP-binding protein
MRVRSHRRLSATTRTLAAVGVLLLVVVLGGAVFADVLAQHPPDRTTGAQFEAPSAEHWLGTDDLGRDLFAQLVHGARVSVTVGLVAATLAMVIGTVVALVAGWHGGIIDGVLMRLVDLVLSLPFLVLVLVLAAFFGRGVGVTIVLIAGVLWARPARLLRSQVLKIREQGHVVAANAMGARTSRILGRHVLPRLVPLVTSQYVRAATVAVVVQAGVAFLGLGDPGRVSWGSMLFLANNASAILTDAWRWWILPPGLALSALIVGLAFVGFALEERAEPLLATNGWRRPVRRTIDPQPPPPAEDNVALDVRGLSVRYGSATALTDVSFRVSKGRVLGIAGESGSGKSTVALAVLGLLPSAGEITSGHVLLGDTDLRRLGRVRLNQVRGRSIGFIPQAAMSLLDPTLRIHQQVRSSCLLTLTGNAASERASELLERVGLERDRHRAFPHELSGGMRQRVVIAAALANGPGLVIADEPTTGLDVVTQAEILALLARLGAEMGLDVVLISHDLRLVGAHADDLAVVYAGRVVEHGPAATVLSAPSHPYTAALLDAFPDLDDPTKPLRPIPGDPPDAARLPPGCSFEPRCPVATNTCAGTVPALVAVGRTEVACVLAGER